MGEAFALKGDMDQAIAEYEKALEIDPNDVDTHDNLGLAFLQMRKANEAMVQFREALRLKPDDGNAQVYLTKAKVMARQNHPSPSR
jgi:tetratricopeptide (TPR) repeat protein